MLRRLLMDSDAFRGEVIFTFDGDAAGMKAAERAFADDQKFMSATFVAVEQSGLDPCELRQKSGELAVRDLVASRLPLVEFVLRTTIGRFDLDTVEGRSSALDASVPIVARIKDADRRDDYARRLAGLVGVLDDSRVLARVRAFSQSGGRSEHEARRRPQPPVDDAVASVEREMLKIAMQLPALAGPVFDALPTGAFVVPAHQRLREAIALAGGTAEAVSGPSWAQAVAQQLTDEDTKRLVHALAVEPLHTGADSPERYAEAVLARLQEIVVSRQVLELKSRLQRINPLEQPDDHARLFAELIALEKHRQTLRDRAIGAA
jgi:DNA primase